MEMFVSMSREDIRLQHRLLKELEEAEGINPTFSKINISSMPSGTKPICRFEFDSHCGNHRGAPDYLSKRREIFIAKIGEALDEYKAWLRNQMYLDE